MTGRPASSSRGAQPIDGKTSELIIRIDKDFYGHAFLILVDSQGQQESFGFYPFNFISDDSTHSYDHETGNGISTQQHQSMVHCVNSYLKITDNIDWLGNEGSDAFVDEGGQVKKQFYQTLNGRWSAWNNCVEFVITVAKAGGITVPRTSNPLIKLLPHSISSAARKDPRMICRLSSEDEGKIYKCVER
jgi:hypothetical protein